MKRCSLLMTLIVCILALSACAPREESGTQMDYEETKKMVVDILKTDDGKKALQEVMKDEEMKQVLIMDQNVVKETIETTMTSDKGAEFWKKVFEDPKFVESFATSIKDEHEKVIKGLMTDPEYQKMLIDVLKDPEMEKSMLEAAKSQEFRKHLQDIVMETLSSPLYKVKIQETLLKAAEEAGQQSGGSQQGQEQEQGSGGGQEQGAGGGS
ncbi:spore germination lipoprotein GerD [Metabacillus halosaccharovorans]|uniref:Spore germination lipoprotein GerD n=1 Tax=Metabacillus halosaccharovorans TaxID=930124 RepID=A0ABT3DC97_9BACI|nr:spore germination lipoprotein GerD [Metabacillus halosaccharovorans]MCV9884181.1 spore germination lipoprotein GerD [Metabacillus halosaccharovorans]